MPQVQLGAIERRISYVAERQDYTLVARQKPTEDDSPSDSTRWQAQRSDVSLAGQQLPASLHGYLAPDVTSEAVGSILAGVPGGVGMLETWVRRFENDPSVKHVLIEIDLLPAEPVIVPTLDTVLKGEAYLSFEHKVWEWWDASFPTAPPEIRIAVW